MSRINFHSLEKTVEVTGSDRAHFNGLVSEMFAGLLNLRSNADLISPLIPSRHYMYQTSPNSMALDNWASQIETSISVGMLDLELDGNQLSSYALSLNTAQRYGGDALKLAARIHAQSELHGWVDGPNRAWLATIIEQAPTTIFRDKAWSEVVKLLRSTAEGEVVMSYSVGDLFPNFSYSSNHINWESSMAEEEELEVETLEEEWYSKSDEDKWKESMTYLKSVPGKLEIKPDDWVDYTYSHGLDALSLLEIMRRRLDSSTLV